MKLSDASLTNRVRDTRGRYRGIDSIRAISAAIVVFGHIGFFESAHSHSAYIPDVIIRVLAFLWNGPAAVIVFFIISGFCIHLPYRGDRPMLLLSYLSRRLLRIGIPATVAIGLAVYVVHANAILNGVLWSILCEVIYYILYPLLRNIARRTEWIILIWCTYAAGLVLALTHLSLLSKNENAYTGLGTSWTWFLGLPVWLAGCWLAEKSSVFPTLTRPQMWALRGFIFSLSVALRVLKFHVHNPLASNALTLNLFAVPACLWVGCEIRYFEHIKAWRPLEWAGTWSYSLYLVHPMIIPALTLIPIVGINSSMAHFHFALLLSAFPVAYIYYLAVEKPSHSIAVKASRIL